MESLYIVGARHQSPLINSPQQSLTDNEDKSRDVDDNKDCLSLTKAFKSELLDSTLKTLSHSSTFKTLSHFLPECE